MDPVTLGIGGAVLGAATSAASASAQNRAIKRSAASQREAERTSTMQINAQERQEIDENRRIAAQVSARTRVLSIASGGSGGDTRDDLLRTVAIDAGRNSGNIETNAANRVASVRSGTSANLAQLGASLRSVALDTVGGGLSGFNTGLGIYRGGRELFRGDE